MARGLAQSREIWRIVKARRTFSAFDGEGARRFGGRWNSPGTPMVYTSGTLSLAALELLVHLDLQEEPSDLIAIQALLPKGLQVDVLEASDLPATWRNLPSPEDLRELGSRWVREARTPVLSVPSVIVPRERNFLLNPLHPAMARIRVVDWEPFTLDSRVFKGKAAPSRRKRRD
ncbi:MAG: RES family NAD+ phosphorylase [Acidobacteriota bacterium]